MRIKLILAADPTDPMRKKNPFKPLSLSLLAGAVPEHDYELIDMFDANDIDYESEVDLVGISVRRSSEQTAFEIADKFINKGVKVVMGGPQVSANPFESLSHASSVVVGEGEELWVKLLQDNEKNELKEFYVSAPNSSFATGHSVFQLESLPSLDKIPKPKRDLFKKKYTFELVFASRGCAINCDFCSVTRLFGSKYRLRPVDDVVNEITEFKAYYYLIDDTVFGRPNTYDYYLELYEKISNLKKINYWTGQANLDAASNEKGREVIKKAVKAGLIYTAIGMESISKEVLQKSGSYSKMGVGGATDMIKKMKENIRFIQEQGILISAWFAIGYEEDDLETYYTTLKFCQEMNILPVFTPLHAIQGTDLSGQGSRIPAVPLYTINVTNVPHPTITNQQVIDALDYVNQKGFSLMATLKRTYIYFKILTKHKDNKIGDIVHKTIFTFITQWRFGKITKLETEKLKMKM